MRYEESKVYARYEPFLGTRSGRSLLSEIKTMFMSRGKEELSIAFASGAEYERCGRLWVKAEGFVNGLEVLIIVK